MLCTRGPSHCSPHCEKECVTPSCSVAEVQAAKAAALEAEERSKAEKRAAIEAAELAAAEAEREALEQAELEKAEEMRVQQEGEQLKSQIVAQLSQFRAMQQKLAQQACCSTPHSLLPCPSVQLMLPAYIPNTQRLTY